MRRCVVTCAIIAVALSASAHPYAIPAEPPSFLVQEDPGRTSFSASLGRGGAEIVVARSIASRLDVAAVVMRGNPFDLRLRLLVVRDLLPLRVEAELGQDRALIIGALCLGPVRVEVARSWGREAARWGVVRVASRPDVSFVLGLRSTPSGVGPLVGFGWRPCARAMWEVSVLWSGRGLRLSIGGVV